MSFRRHLGALLRKNVLLKRRSPCSLCAELFLAMVAIALLALARFLTSDLQAREFEAKHHVQQTMPVRLPDCAEFLPDCAVELVSSRPKSPSCVKGLTYGCESDALETGRMGVWTVMGCWGTFRLKGQEGEHVVTCTSGQNGKPVSCPVPDPSCESTPESERVPCGWSSISGRACLRKGCCFEPTRFGPKCFQKGRRLRLGMGSSSPLMSASSLMSLLRSGQGGVRRLDATFAVAGEGKEQFAQWLRASDHPWAPRIRLFDTGEDVEQHLRSDSYPQRSENSSEMLCGAVVFETPPWGPKAEYSLRFNQSLGYDPNLPQLASLFRSKLTTKGLVEPPKGGQPQLFDASGLTWYAQSGFLALQRTVDTFLERCQAPDQDVEPKFGNHWMGEDGRPHLVVPFPSPKWSLDIFATAIPQLLAGFLLISLAYPVNRMITGVVMEREARLREGMRMMGMGSSAFYASWVVTYVLLYLFVVSGVVVLLCRGQILPRSSPSLLFMWLMLFALASMAYGLVITTFFSRAKTAATVGSIFFYTTSFLKYLATSRPWALALSLLPPVAFELGGDLVAGLEGQQVGVVWSNAGVSYHDYSLQESCLMLAADTVLLFLLFLYLDQVMPREVGLQRPWYFPLQISFWVGHKESVEAPPEPTSPERSEVHALVEHDTGEAAAMMARTGQTVELCRLCKHFGNLRAVQNLDLVMYQGEIFALLGHNGAGKTTTLAMLCGLMPPSCGSCRVFGSERPEEVQRLLGVCPQHDVLWDELTCEEHLQLFAGFKGVPKEAVAEEVATMLERVGLAKAGAGRVRAGKLSGGMKRKLSLGIAFLGGSRLVVLDEPTSGLDPFSRRAVWELLRSMKQGRVTVLSTHYMDEADILGDRIAILHEGRLRCCGSPQFLKRAYDCGYNITFVKKPGCNTEAVREAVCRHVPEFTSEVTVLSNSGKELILQFPFSAARHFPQVLSSLEQHLLDLKLESYGISVTTLEEVFLKVASGEAPRPERTKPSGGSPTGMYIELGELGGEVQAREVFSARERSAGSGGASVLRQTQALLRKRVRYGLRDKKGLLCQLLMPPATLLLFLLVLSHNLFSSQPVLELAVLDYNTHCSQEAPGGKGDGGEGAQNLVEFTFLPSVEPAAAEALLKPGEALWNGGLRKHLPPLVGDGEKQLEQAAFVRAPQMWQKLLRELEHWKGKSGRRLQAGELPTRASLELWSSFLRGRQALEELAGVFPQGHLLLNSWMEQASPRRLQDKAEAPPERPHHRHASLNWRACPGASSMERTIWAYLDKDADGVISRQDLHQVLHDLEHQGDNSSATKFFAEQMLRQVLRQQLGFDLDLNSTSEKELDEWLDWLVEEVVLASVDLDGDGVVSQEEFCRVGEEIHGEVSQLYNLGQHFSQQILDSSSTCPRYGAYYVTASPRNPAESDAIIFANASSKHSPGVFQAALTNLRLAKMGQKKTVAVKVHLFPQTKDEQVTLERFAGLRLAIYITFCLSFIPAGIAHYLVKERSSGARQLQALSGASHLAYWLANLIYDLALYALPALSVPVALQHLGYHTLMEGDCGSTVLTTLGLFGPAVAGYSYVVSFCFKDHSRASNTILTISIFGAIVLSTVLFVLAIVNYDPTAEYPSACEYPTEEHPEGNCRFPGARTAYKILGPIFRMIPSVCIYQALFSVALVANLRAVIPEGAMDALQAVGGKAPKVSLQPFAFEWAGEPMIYLAVEGVAFFLLAIFIDVAVHSPWLSRQLDASSWAQRVTRWKARGSDDPARLSPLISGSVLEGDDSVWAERERAQMATKEDLALHVWDLEKVYRRCCRASKRAVRGVSFAIHGGEVFGLLGHNGAGKTSAIKCFVGEQCCSMGTVHVGGFDMERDTFRARRRLGYCPQFDALLELLTVQDHLELYGAIRGLDREAVQETLRNFKLEKMARRRGDVLSGGNKRKLSAALALMGSPALAILDEPSCGLDPAARRALWTAVHEAVGGSARAPSAVLLTTHSMEEAEALSNRLGIMADGQLLTVGTAQQIKAKHGSSHELVVRLKPETEEALFSLMRRLNAGGSSALDARAVTAILEQDSWKRAALARPRCVVRALLENGGLESLVFAEWWLQQAKGERLQEFLQALVGDRVELAEDFGIYWRFRLPRSGLSLPQLFHQLEENVEKLGVAEYTLSQATLEQIFNSITAGAEHEA